MSQHRDGTRSFPGGTTAFLSTVDMPRGGGALRGLGETLGVQAAAGTAGLSIPLPFPGARGTSPEVALGVYGGSGPSAFGLDVRLACPSIARRTEKGVPRYDDDTDVFVIGDGDELVPVPGEATRAETFAGKRWSLTRYLSRTESAFTHVERARSDDGDTCWRTLTGDDVTRWYGRSPEARVADPEDPRRIFRWLLEESGDDRGNVVLYGYEGAARAGEPAERYLARIWWGNATPFEVDPDRCAFVAAFDYGDHAPDAPTPLPDEPAPARMDVHLDGRAGFLVAIRRLCLRVLVFHRFGDALGPGPTPRLVSSLDLSHAPDALGSRLVAFTRTAWQWDDAGSRYQRESWPSVTLQYTRSKAAPEVQTIALDPAFQSDTGAAHWQWVDLDGEGLPGLLAHEPGGWSYRRNEGDGRLGAPVLLPQLPSFVPGSEPVGLADVSEAGRRALVRLHGALPGFHERIDAPEGRGWSAFRTFDTLPQVDFDDPGTRLVDLDGDGLPDVLVAEEDGWTWFRGKGPAGWGDPIRVVPRPGGSPPPLRLVASPTEVVFVADINGDGLADIVRVRDGQVTWWPSLGHGRFGEPVEMRDAPRFDVEGGLDAARLRLGDVAGSGAADLVSLGPGSVRIWANASGASWVPLADLPAGPPPEAVAEAAIVDLLGTGTGCLVWGEPRRDGDGVQLRYLDLSRREDAPQLADYARAGCRAGLLVSVKNGLGAERHLHYTSSTRFYLEDRAAGQPWPSRIPFPISLVSREDVYDAIAGTTIVRRYRFHDGAYDGRERELRGFACVEQWDADEAVGVGADPDAPAPRSPVRRVSWYHVGNEETDTTHRARRAAKAWAADTWELATPLLPADLSTPDRRHALRALAGTCLREEVYAEDGSPASHVPFVVSATRPEVRLLWPSAGERPAVVQVLPCETLSVHLERDPAEARVAHAVTLEVDEWGSVREAVEIAYGRVGSAHPEQRDPVIAHTRSEVIHRPEAPAVHLLGVPFETRRWSIEGLPAAVAPRYTLAEIRNHVTSVAEGPDVAFDDDTPAASPRRRLLAHSRTVHARADQTGPLPLGSCDRPVVPWRTLSLALTPGLVARTFEARLDPSLLVSEGRYELDVSGWWAPSSVRRHDPSRFWLPVGEDSLDGNVAWVEWDAAGLFVTAVGASRTVPHDALVTRFRHDYRVLAPTERVDPHGHLERLAFDLRGLVRARWVRGRNGEGDPDALPGTVFRYDLAGWSGGRGAALAEAEVRERYGDPDASVQTTRMWSDGFGRLVLTKTRVEGGVAWARHPDGRLAETPTGSAPRWLATGRTVYDEKGDPVRTWEPWFAASSGFDDDPLLVAQGVSRTLHRDPIGRVTRVSEPDGTFTRTRIGPWTQEEWDANDTVDESRWYRDRTSGAAPPEERRAAALAHAHHATPLRTTLDVLGRPFLSETDTGNRRLVTRTSHHPAGYAARIVDPEGRVAQEQVCGLLGQVLRTRTPDGGTRWAVADALGRSMRTWDTRGHVRRVDRDVLGRDTHAWLTLPDGREVLEGRTVYGEALPEWRERGIGGVAAWVADPAGISRIERRDFAGRVTHATRRLVRETAGEIDWRPVAGPLDADGLAAAAEPLLDPDTFTSASTYDALGRVLTQVLPDGDATRAPSELRPRYHVGGSLAALDVRAGGVTRTYLSELRYDAKRRIVSAEYACGATGTWTYDRLSGRIARASVRRSSDDASLQDLAWTYDPVGNPMEVSDRAKRPVFFDNGVAAATSRYVYDAVYRLVEATGREHPGVVGLPYDADTPWITLPHPNDQAALRTYTERYSYDGCGNLLEVVHAAGAQGSWRRAYDYVPGTNRLGASTLYGEAPGARATPPDLYDAHGNLRAMPHLPALVWDPRDQLRRVALPAGDLALYTVDGAGERVRKVVRLAGGVEEERVTLSGTERFRRRINGTLQLERRTVVFPLGDARAVRIESTAPAASSPGGTRVRYTLGDRSGSGNVELDDTAGVLSVEEYHPFGTTAVRAGVADETVSAKRYRYNGKERDDETKLYHYGARYYASWLGRWTSCDPSGLVDGPCPYAYVRNNPIRYGDPDGRETEEISRKSTWWDRTVTAFRFTGPGLFLGPLVSAATQVSRGELPTALLSYHPVVAIGQGLSGIPSLFTTEAPRAMYKAAEAKQRFAEGKTAEGVSASVDSGLAAVGFLIGAFGLLAAGLGLGGLIKGSVPKVGGKAGGGSKGGGVDPLAATGVDPLAATGVDPLAATGVDPLAKTAVNPLAKTAVDPMAATGVDPLGATVPGPQAVRAPAGLPAAAPVEPPPNAQRPAPAAARYGIQMTYGEMIELIANQTGQTPQQLGIASPGVRPVSAQAAQALSEFANRFGIIEQLANRFHRFGASRANYPGVYAEAVAGNPAGTTPPATPPSTGFVSANGQSIKFYFPFAW